MKKRKYEWTEQSQYHDRCQSENCAEGRLAHRQADRGRGGKAADQEQFPSTRHQGHAGGWTGRVQEVI